MADASSLRKKVLQRGQKISVGTAREMQRELQHAASKHRKTGELNEAIKVRALGAGPRYRLHAEAEVLQAVTTNTGARPHKIRAKKGKTLAFYWPKAGRVIFPVEVDHPGNRGSHWWDTTMRGPVLRRAMKEASRAA